MKVQLDKEDLINLITSIEPSYDLINTGYLTLYGNLVGTNDEGWEWFRSILETEEENKLFEIYQKTKQSIYDAKLSEKIFDEISMFLEAYSNGQIIFSESSIQEIVESIIKIKNEIK